MAATAGNRGRGPIAVDLGTHHVRMLQLAGAPARPRVVAAAERALPPNTPPTGAPYHEAVGEAIASMLNEAPFRGRAVVSALPAHVVHFKNVRLPRMPPAELAQAVEWEAAERLQLDDVQVDVQYFDAGEVRQGEELRQEVILLAAPVAFTEAYVRTLVGCGLQPLAFDVTPAALCRCLGQIDQPDPATDLDAPGQVIIDVGYQSSKVLVARGGDVLFFKLIEMGGAKLDEMVAEQLNLARAEAAETRQRLTQTTGDESTEQPAMFGAKHEDEMQRAVYEAVRPAITDLAREVSLCLRYYSVTFRGERPDEMMLVGGEASQPALASLLAEDTGVSVAPMQPAASLQMGKWESLLTRGAGQSAWATAIGMARRREAAQRKRRAA